MPENETIDGVWAAFLECGLFQYTGFPDRIRADQGPQFKWPRWKDLMDIAGIELQLSGIEHQLLLVLENVIMLRQGA